MVLLVVCGAVGDGVVGVVDVVVVGVVIVVGVAVGIGVWWCHRRCCRL